MIVRGFNGLFPRDEGAGAAPVAIIEADRAQQPRHHSPRNQHCARSAHGSAERMDAGGQCARRHRPDTVPRGRAGAGAPWVSPFGSDEERAQRQEWSGLFLRPIPCRSRCSHEGGPPAATHQNLRCVTRADLVLESGHRSASSATARKRTARAHLIPFLLEQSGDQSCTSAMRRA
jgi:hypothetical protein